MCALVPAVRTVRVYTSVPMKTCPHWAERGSDLWIIPALYLTIITIYVAALINPAHGIPVHFIKRNVRLILDVGIYRWQKYALAHTHYPVYTLRILSCPSYNTSFNTSVSVPMWDLLNHNVDVTWSRGIDLICFESRNKVLYSLIYIEARYKGWPCIFSHKFGLCMYWFCLIVLYVNNNILMTYRTSGTLIKWQAW
jgi:hypothetical protein